MKKSNVNFRAVDVSKEFVNHVADYVANTATVACVKAVYAAKINPLRADINLTNLMVSLSPAEKEEKVAAIQARIEALTSEMDAVCAETEKTHPFKATKADKAFAKAYQSACTPTDLQSALRDYFAQYGLTIDGTTFESDLMMIGLYQANGKSVKTVRTGMLTGMKGVNPIINAVMSITGDWMISARVVSCVESYMTDEVKQALKAEDDRRKAVKDALKNNKKNRKNKSK